MEDKLYYIEEKINSRSRSFDLGKEIQLTDIDTAIRMRMTTQTAVDYVINKLTEKGFQTKDGQADWVSFYKYARIEPDVWSTFSSGTHVPGKETLLKIIIALRLNEKEARELMALAGSGFRSEDYRDRVILACMDCGYYEIEDVYMILEEYGSQLVNGKRRFKNIY